MQKTDANDIRKEAQGLARELWNLSLRIANAAQRLEDGTVQAHMEAYSVLRHAQDDIDILKDEIQKNNIRWAT